MASEWKIDQGIITAEAGDRIEVSVTPIAFDSIVWCYCLDPSQRDGTLPWQAGDSVSSEGFTGAVLALTFHKGSDFFLVPSDGTWLIVVRAKPDQMVKVIRHAQAGVL